MALFKDNQYRQAHGWIGAAPVDEVVQRLEVSAEAIADHLTGQHPKHRAGLARLNRLMTL